MLSVSMHTSMQYIGLLSSSSQTCKHLHDSIPPCRGSQRQHVGHGTEGAQGLSSLCLSICWWVGDCCFISHQINCGLVYLAKKGALSEKQERAERSAARSCQA